MKFIFGYAGIPIDAFDGVRRKEAHISGGAQAIFCSPVTTRTRGTYSPNHWDKLLREFADRVANDHQNELWETGFAIVYVDHGDPETSRFVGNFFPSTLCVKVDWILTQGSKRLEAQSKNELVVKLKYATNQARDALVELRKELAERDSRTPLLLPVHNFTSRHLTPALLALQEQIVRSRDKRAALQHTVGRLEEVHPPRHDQKRFFVDDRNIEFRPPGSHRDRHGIARTYEDHPPTCLLSGRRRLGAPYDRAFHYDCVRGRDKLSEYFFGCHQEREEMEGDPHVNIAPNDFVRAKRKRPAELAVA